MVAYTLNRMLLGVARQKFSDGGLTMVAHRCHQNVLDNKAKTKVKLEIKFLQIRREIKIQSKFKFLSIQK